VLAAASMYLSFCSPPVRPSVSADQAKRLMPQFWEQPSNLATHDMVYGPWGREHAPRRSDVYTFEHTKKHGVNPGMTVKDSEGREWSVKQGEEAHVEVLLSRILTAVGYHQPPVYFLETFTLNNADGAHEEDGGRFRLKTPQLEDLGEWSWQRNPFVGTRPYNGLLSILMLFASSDLKNNNNTLYRYQPAAGGDHPQVWYVVRDLGTSLGETAHIAPRRNDPQAFARQPFVTTVDDGYVAFGYSGWHKELVTHRITAADVTWACRLLSNLSDAQWAEAFRGAGYDAEIGKQFMPTLKSRIDAGLALGKHSAVATAVPALRE
jgi:hypothetical protein